MKKFRKYKFFYVDRYNNDLLTTEAEAYNLKEAKKIAQVYLSNSNINDLYKIIVKPK